MRWLFRLLPILMISLATPSAHAEYRAFQLVITNRVTGATYTVTSILDDIQFPMYYPVSSNETVTMTASWMCWGRQGDFLAICPNPKATKP